MEFNATEVNQDIIIRGTVLGYTYFTSIWFPLPWYWENANGTGRQNIVFSYALNRINLYAFRSSGVLGVGGFTEFRFMLITDNTVTSGGRVSSDESVMDRLNDAGVDINNYEEVCQYYGIDPN